jgi:hypothetical protein
VHDELPLSLGAVGRLNKRNLLFGDIACLSGRLPIESHRSWVVTEGRPVGYQLAAMSSSRSAPQETPLGVAGVA